MTLPLSVRAVTFDCFGTLIDWNRGIGAFLSQWSEIEQLSVEADTLTQGLAAAQRKHQTHRPFKPYRRVLHDAFLDLAATYGVEGAVDDAVAFSASVATWPAFDDTLSGLHALKEMAVLGVMSNVDNESFRDAHKIHLGGLIDDIVTADDVQAYKPDHALFEAMASRLGARGIDQDAWLHVAQSRFHDIAPCNERGLACVWLDRVGNSAAKGMTVMAPGADPDRRVDTMDEVVAIVASANR